MTQYLYASVACFLVCLLSLHRQQVKARYRRDENVTLLLNKEKRLIHLAGSLRSLRGTQLTYVGSMTIAIRTLFNNEQQST